MEEKEEKEEQKEVQKLSVLEETKNAIKTLKEEKEEIKKIKEELDTLRSDQLLSSSAGGRVEAPQVSEEDLKKKQAKEFWKGTAIEDAIDKHNE